MHDATVDRTTNGTGAVHEMTLASIRGLTVTAHPDYGHGLVMVPSCEDAIKAARGLELQMVIEVKERHRREVMVSTLAHLFDAYDLFDSAVVASFDPIFLYQMRRHDERIHTLLFFLPNGLAQLCSPHLALVAAPPPAVVCAMSDLLDPVYSWAFSSWLPTLLGVSIVGPHHSMASEHFIHAWAARGVLTNVWTLNVAASKQHFQQLGVLVTTDCPTWEQSCQRHAVVGRH